MVDDSIFAARQIKILLFGDYKKRVKIHLFTDSEAMLESIAYSKQIDRKTLRLTVVDLKERLMEGNISSYSGYLLIIFGGCSYKRDASSNRFGKYH